MKYKSQALNKLQKIEHQIRALEIAINRGSSLGDINVIIAKIKELNESLHETISIEKEEWN
jgi:DNA-binding FrmR family transcriptional regulator